MNDIPDTVISLDEAEDDMRNLDQSQRIAVIKTIIKVAGRPQPKPEGYGSPLSGSLSGLNKKKIEESWNPGSLPLSENS